MFFGIGGFITLAVLHDAVGPIGLIGRLGRRLRRLYNGRQSPISESANQRGGSAAPQKGLAFLEGFWYFMCVLPLGGGNAL